MHINLGAEMALNLRLDQSVSYAALETLLVDAGYTHYVIMRDRAYDGSMNVTLIIRADQDDPSTPDVLPAAETLTALGAAVATLSDHTHEEEPEEEPTP
jgi:hypothetical protein